MRLFLFISMLFSPLVIAEDISRSVPEAFTGLNYTKAALAEKAMVSAANPHAVNAGLEVLKKGGNAVDAAIAVQVMLTLVEPQSSGIGGGAFMLYFDQEKNRLLTYDGREMAPSQATPELFLDKNGKPIKWIDAVIGGRSVGVPGVLKMLEKAHRQYGKLKWAELFRPTIELANKGFVVSPRLAKLVKMEMNPGLKLLSPAKEYFYPGGQAIKKGELLINKPLAKALTLIAHQGVDAFYNGEIAHNIVSSVTKSKIAPGKLSLSDMSNYQSIIREPVCVTYNKKEQYKICSMGPPSSGGITVLQILKILEPFSLTSHAIDSVSTIHRITQAARLAFADRNKYIADSDFVNVPVSKMLDSDYLLKRSSLISDQKDMGKAKAGNFGLEIANNVSIEQPNTSHISIVDQSGNAVSMTTSIEMGFGSTVMVDGFLLNNQLTDFSLRPKINGKLVANRVEPNKRPRSSMSPVMVFKDNELYAILGSPGGSRIINYVAYALVGLLDYGYDMQQVVNMPRVSNRNGYTSLEAGQNLQNIKTALEEKGHKVKLLNLTSGIHGILKKNGQWQGAADPRREGTAAGF
jgi:gamma-glutamyltranspeptidase / glutathione hydrolase